MDRFCKRNCNPGNDTGAYGGRRKNRKRCAGIDFFLPHAIVFYPVDSDISLLQLFLHRADSECFFHRKHSELPCYAPLTSESGQIHFLNFICRKLYIVSMRTDLLRCILTFFSFIAQNFVCPLGYIFLQFQECHKIGDFQFLRYVYGCNDRKMLLYWDMWDVSVIRKIMSI